MAHCALLICRLGRQLYNSIRNGIDTIQDCFQTLGYLIEIDRFAIKESEIKRKRIEGDIST